MSARTLRGSAPSTLSISLIFMSVDRAAAAAQRRIMTHRGAAVELRAAARCAIVAPTRIPIAQTDHMAENPASLNQAALQALAAGDFATAQALLVRLVAADPASVPGWLNLAAVRRRLNDAEGAF